MRNVRMAGALSAVLALSIASKAVAQTAPTGVALGLERAFGFEHNTLSRDVAGNEVTTSRTSLGFGLGGGATMFGTTRFGIDAILQSGVSVGTGVGLATYSSEQESNGVSVEGPSITRFIVAPRVGYFAMLTHSVGLWPRGGITYVSASSEFTPTDTTVSSEASESDLALTLEVPLVIMPAKNFGFLIAPVLDLVMCMTPSRMAATSMRTCRTHPSAFNSESPECCRPAARGRRASASVPASSHDLSIK